MADADTRGPKERHYDEHIAPLVTRVIEECRKANINFVQDFELDRDPDEDPTDTDNYMHCFTGVVSNVPHGTKIARTFDAGKPKPTFAIGIAVSTTGEILDVQYFGGTHHNGNDSSNTSRDTDNNDNL